MTCSDARRVSAVHKAIHGIAGTLGSLNSTHVFCKNCPVGCQGCQTGNNKSSNLTTIILKAFADQLFCINILNQSCLLKAFLDGLFASKVDFEYTVNDRVFHCLWLAVDGIYP